jgi:hypothetical protein
MSKKDSNYISLKEAAELSGYSADYVGQLIREGKVHGKQIFSNVAWVTTEAAIREYVEQKGKVSHSGYGAYERLKERYTSLEGLLDVSRAVLIVATALASALTLVALVMFILALDRSLERNAMETTEYAP